MVFSVLHCCHCLPAGVVACLHDQEQTPGVADLIYRLGLQFVILFHCQIGESIIPSMYSHKSCGLCVDVLEAFTTYNLCYCLQYMKTLLVKPCIGAWIATAHPHYACPPTLCMPMHPHNYACCKKSIAMILMHGF